MGPAICVAVLVVEDEPDIRECVVQFLLMEGFHVYQAGNGLEAIEALRNMPQPALILADLMMPVMDGPSLIAALREDDQFASLPVVIVSASNNELSGYRRVKKPVDLDDLRIIVEEFCARRI
jgi:CheY-like chemotaxis protein